MNDKKVIGYAVQVGKGYVSEAEGYFGGLVDTEESTAPVKLSSSKIKLFNGLYGIKQAIKIAEFCGGRVVTIFAGLQEIKVSQDEED